MKEELKMELHTFMFLSVVFQDTENDREERVHKLLFK